MTDTTKRRCAGCVQENFAETMRQLAATWRSMSEEQKDRYRQLAAERRGDLAAGARKSTAAAAAAAAASTGAGSRHRSRSAGRSRSRASASVSNNNNNNNNNKL